MRHIGSLLIALVVAPAVFLLTGTGLSAFESALDDNLAVDPLGAMAALGALILAGILYGILVMARLSPLGPGLAGFAAIGLSGWALADIASYESAFAQLDVHMGGAIGQLGLGILLGVPLVGTIFSSRRWRRDEGQPIPTYPQRPDPTWQMPAYQPPPDIAAPSLRYPDVAEPLPKRVPNPPPPAMMPSEEPTFVHGSDEVTVKLEQQVKQQGESEEEGRPAEEPRGGPVAEQDRQT